VAYARSTSSTAEVALVERAIAHDALNWPDARRLMTVPGVNLIVAVSFLATIGDIHRFPDRRKACVFWALLWRQQDYAFGQPSLTAKKIRRLEITAGAPRWQDRRGVWAANLALRKAERDLARQAEHAYAQTIRDRQAAGAIKAGTSATPGRASQKPTRGKAARQTTSP